MLNGFRVLKIKQSLEKSKCNAQWENNYQSVHRHLVALLDSTSYYSYSSGTIIRSARTGHTVVNSSEMLIDCLLYTLHHLHAPQTFRVCHRFHRGTIPEQAKDISLNNIHKHVNFFHHICNLQSTVQGCTIYAKERELIGKPNVRPTNMECPLLHFQHHRQYLHFQV